MELDFLRSPGPLSIYERNGNDNLPTVCPLIFVAASKTWREPAAIFIIYAIVIYFHMCLQGGKYLCGILCGIYPTAGTLEEKWYLV